MLEAASIRCSACRTVVPLTVVWASGDLCPGCARALVTNARRRPGPAGVLGKSLALLRAHQRGVPRRPSRALP